MQSPVRGRRVLGIDPAFRTGCKAAAVDEFGQLLEYTTIYPHEPQRRWEEALQTLAALVEKHGITLITIGNGTASRETERLVAELIKAPLPPGAVPGGQRSGRFRLFSLRTGSPGVS